MGMDTDFTQNAKGMADMSLADSMFAHEVCNHGTARSPTVDGIYGMYVLRTQSDPLAPLWPR